MNKFKDAIIYFIAVIIIILLFTSQLIFKNQFVPPIYGPNEVFILIGAYIIGTQLIYQFLKGIVVSEKSTIFRNIIVLFVGNFIIYSVLFFSNSSLKYSDFFNPSALNYFIGYFIFSISAAFIGSNLFYQYRQEINKNGYHRYVIWKYFLQAIVTNLFLYFVFTQLINPFFPVTIFYPHVMNYIMIGFITIIFLSIFYFLEKKRQSFEKRNY